MMWDKIVYNTNERRAYGYFGLNDNFGFIVEVIYNVDEFKKVNSDITVRIGFGKRYNLYNYADHPLVNFYSTTYTDCSLEEAEERIKRYINIALSRVLLTIGGEKND